MDLHPSAAHSPSYYVIQILELSDPSSFLDGFLAFSSYLSGFLGVTVLPVESLN